VCRGEYRDLHEICADIRLMWDNAWLYNKRGSRIHKNTTKLNELFEQRVDPVMRRLGFCCGNRLYFTPYVILRAILRVVLSLSFSWYVWSFRSNFN
jgi:E1A/CREB-binding protein